MLRPSLFTVVLGVALSTACSKPSTDAPRPPPPAPPVASAAPIAPTPPAPVAASGKMAHCPSTIADVRTDIQDVPGGVAITVTSTDDATTREIRARSAFLVSSTKNDATPTTHNGTGEGGGVFGRCPVVMRNTTVAETDIAGGAKLVVLPRDAREQDWIRHEARSRLVELSAPGSDGAGIGKMAHCPNAVKGATTQIAGNSGAVLITVTAKDDVSVKEIRDRAKQIVLVSQKTEAGQIKHDGSGNGGGGFGRCPVVLKDTAVIEKDAPGGAVITVKPKNAKDLTALTQQVRDRSAKFD